MAARLLLRVALREGLDPVEVFEGTGLRWRDLLAGTGVVGWDAYATMIGRVSPRIGGAHAFERLGERQILPSPAWASVSAGFSAPIQLYAFLATVLPSVWRATRQGVERTGEGILFYRMETDGRRTPLPEVAAFVVGALRSAPTRLGLPPAAVRVRDVGPRSVEWRVTLPASPLCATGARDAISLPDDVDSTYVLLDELDRQHTALVAEREIALRALGASIGSFALLDPTGRVAWALPDTGWCAGEPWRGKGTVRRPPGMGGHAIATFRDPVAEHVVRLEGARARWGLTPAQASVLGELVHGRTNRAIAEALGIASATVEVHATALYRKARVGGRAEMVATFWRRRWER